MQTFYQILGVPPDVDGKELKRAYRELAKRFHPDHNPGDPRAETQFKAVAQAYECLSDSRRRMEYDQRLEFERMVSQPEPPEPGRPRAERFGEFLGGIFGAAWNKAKARRGRDVSYPIKVTLEEVLSGVETSIEIATEVACRTCRGKGGQPNTGVTECPRCGGNGEINVSTLGRAGPCPKCYGLGHLPHEPCESCEGTGRVRDLAPFDVFVPAGVSSGHRIRHSGLGERGSGGAANGDLFVIVEVAEHPLFTRDETDVYCAAILSPAEVALGTELEAPTLEGSVRMKVPAGTQPGKLFRLPGRGLPKPGTKRRGNQIVEIRVETPVDLTQRQKVLLRELEESLGNDHLPGRTRFRANTAAHLDD